jgi:hypothetical protein
MNPGARVDPTLIGVVGFIVAYVGWQRIRRRPLR